MDAVPLLRTGGSGNGPDGHRCGLQVSAWYSVQLVTPREGHSSLAAGRRRHRCYFTLFDSQPAGTLTHTCYLHCSGVSQRCHNTTCSTVAGPSGARPERLQWESGGHGDTALITCISTPHPPSPLSPSVSMCTARLTASAHLFSA